MVGLKTRFLIGDNSGAVKGECIKVLNSKSQVVKVGSFVVLAIKKVQFKKKMKVKNHYIHYGIVLRTKQFFSRFNGLKVNFDENVVVILDRKGNPMFNRVFGAIPYEIRSKKLTKVLLMAQSVI